MRVSTNFALPVAAVLFGLLLVPRAALAQTSANCPTEPAVNVPIALGEVFAGTNCNLYTVGDIDSFVFTGTSGDTYELSLAVNGASNNICLTLYGPNSGGVPIYGPGCTSIQFGSGYYSVVTSQKLTATGTYTIDITEASGSSGTQNYAVALQELFPFPSYATQVPKWEEPLTGTIAPLTDSNFFTFPAATSGTYQVTATLPSNASQNLCMTVYYSNFTSAGSGCTSIQFGPSYYQVPIVFTPTQAEVPTILVLLQEDGNNATVSSYTLEVSCVVGDCPLPVPPPPPPCTLADTVSYASGTLTMNFTVGNTYPTATWNAWLTYHHTMQSLFSVSQPITNPPVAIPKTTQLSPEDNVGVLSTLATPTNGIVCSSWVQVGTGTAP
jgi:hypothetical protein